jgi:hypothetical protein
MKRRTPNAKRQTPNAELNIQSFFNNFSYFGSLYLEVI